MSTGTIARAEDILAFWFGTSDLDEPAREARQKIWFAADPKIDQEIRARFMSDYEQAAAGTLAHWRAAPHTALALILLFDQLPRNMFRGTPRAFATDRLARTVTAQLLAAGHDTRMAPAERMFAYMPLMHSEDIATQHQSVALFAQLGREHPSFDSSAYAVRHMKIVERFGRFPHRNATLGRVSTPEEIEFLTQPGSSF